MLKSVGTFKKEKHQIDMYYSPEGESFYDCGDRCLRIRTENEESILSYKQIYNENTSKQFIEEYETRIESPDMMECILKALKYRSEIVIDKYRVEYCTDRGFVIALDKVENLGFFIEVENSNESDTLENRNKCLIEFIQRLELDISRRNTEGYSNMMFRKNLKSGDEK
jgi:predicted adenylyl cyclase CyaB